MILTTDHGLAFPDAKATMYDRGIGVMLIIRGPGGFTGGRVLDALVSHLDLYPTICELAGIDRTRVAGRRVAGRRSCGARSTSSTRRSSPRSPTTPPTNRSAPCARAATSTCGGSTTSHPGRVLANVDDGPTKDVMLAAGWAELDPPIEALYDLWLDPAEGTNRIDDPRLAPVLAELRERLHDWMARTGDPLLDGPVAPAKGTQYNTADQISPGGAGGRAGGGSRRDLVGGVELGALLRRDRAVEQGVAGGGHGASATLAQLGGGRAGRRRCGWCLRPQSQKVVQGFGRRVELGPAGGQEDVLGGAVVEVAGTRPGWLVSNRRVLVDGVRAARCRWYAAWNVTSAKTSTWRSSISPRAGPASDAPSTRWRGDAGQLADNWVEVELRRSTRASTRRP